MEPTIVFSLMTICANFALVFVTWMYVRQVKKSVKVMEAHVKVTRDMLKASNTPKVVMFLVLRRDVELLLRVENVGTGYASDIKFTGDLSFQVPGREPLEEIEPFKSGISYLGPGYRVDTSLFAVGDVTVPKHIFDITISYKDTVNIQYDSQPFRFGDWDDASKSTKNIETVDDEIVSRLEGIWVALSDIRNEMRANNAVDDDTTSSE